MQEFGGCPELSRQLLASVRLPDVTIRRTGATRECREDYAYLRAQFCDTLHRKILSMLQQRSRVKLVNLHEALTKRDCYSKYVLVVFLRKFIVRLINGAPAALILSLQHSCRVRLRLISSDPSINERSSASFEAPRVGSNFSQYGLIVAKYSDYALL